MRILFLLLISVSSCMFVYAQSTANSNDLIVGKISEETTVALKKANDGKWGIFINEAGLSSVSQPKPVQIEVYKDSLNITRISSGYNQVSKNKTGFIGKATIKSSSVSFEVSDSWVIKGDVATLSRRVEVSGSNPGSGFLSAITFNNQQKQSRKDVNYFAPGMIYGSTDNITKVAIGGEQAGLITWIREDRLPAPLFGIQYKDGTSVSILNSKPDGNTTKEDSRDLQVKDMIDERFKFGSLGVQEKNDNIEYGYMWPGSEGAVTYRGKTYPGGQLNKWRRRYHP
ncbi:MAG: hypothetical protein WKF68_09395, partial [Daejeonella sp.]